MLVPFPRVLCDFATRLIVVGVVGERMCLGMRRMIGWQLRRRQRGVLGPRNGQPDQEWWFNLVCVSKEG